MMSAFAPHPIRVPSHRYRRHHRHHHRHYQHPQHASRNPYDIPLAGHARFRHATMVMERPANPQPSRNPLSPHLESLDAIHHRLGIQNLWDDDSDNNSQSQSQSSTDPAHDFNPNRHRNETQNQKPVVNDMARNTVVDDVLVIGDDSVPTKSVMPWDTTTGAQGISLLGRRLFALRKRQHILMKSYEECRRITELFSKTFYLGTQLLSPEKRQAVWAVYTWCRRTDDLVDGPRVTQRASHLRAVLADWETRLDQIFAGRGRDGLDLAMADAVSNYPLVTSTPFRDMIKGMLMDVDQARFETFDDLYLYCYRVAGTVGLMTLPIMGTVKPGREGLREAVDAALALGIALQITNILRDVGEDRLRGRIYLPLEDLRRFNYTEEDLMNGVLDSRYKSLIKFEIARARRYFRKAQDGVPLLAEDSRLPVQASLDMYSQILDVLEENGYDNFNRRAYISKSRKLFTVPISFLRTRQHDAWKPFLTAAQFLVGAKPHSG